MIDEFTKDAFRSSAEVRQLIAAAAPLCPGCHKQMTTMWLESVAARVMPCVFYCHKHTGFKYSPSDDMYGSLTNTVRVWWEDVEILLDPAAGQAEWLAKYPEGRRVPVRVADVCTDVHLYGDTIVIELPLDHFEFRIEQ
jgi:hypothetical protein